MLVRQASADPRGAPGNHAGARGSGLAAGSRLARRGPGPDHPFGHGRVRYFAAFLVAVVLFTLGSLLATLAIGALLAVVAVVLGIEMYSLLVGEAASPQEQAAIRRALASTPGIAQLLQLHTMHLSPDELLVVAKVEMDPDLSADNLARVIDAAQARVRQAVPSGRVVYLDQTSGGRELEPRQRRRRPHWIPPNRVNRTGGLASARSCPTETVLVSRRRGAVILPRPARIECRPTAMAVGWSSAPEFLGPPSPCVVALQHHGGLGPRVTSSPACRPSGPVGGAGS